MLISGRGSNLQALILACEDGRLRGRVVLVVSNVPKAEGIGRAREAGIEVVVMRPGDYLSRDAYDRALVGVLQARGVNLVCLAGFMRLLGEGFCTAFPAAVLNVHPSLLPAFPGQGAQRQALEHGVKITGATVHFVTAELDGGPIVAQISVPVFETDDVEALSARILVAEHELYPRAVDRILCDRWRIEGRRVVFASDAESLG